MIAQVTVDEAGGVTVLVDDEPADDDETARRLAGLALDDMLERARTAALATWRDLHERDC